MWPQQIQLCSLSTSQPQECCKWKFLPTSPVDLLEVENPCLHYVWFIDKLPNLENVCFLCRNIPAYVYYRGIGLGFFFNSLTFPPQKSLQGQEQNDEIRIVFMNKLFILISSSFRSCVTV